MLVHAKSPRGVMRLGRFRIHGRETKYRPCDIPFALYNEHKGTLSDGTYREDKLRGLFGMTFPMIAFTYSEIRWLPDKTLDTIGPLMVDQYDRTWSHKKKTDQIKVALRHVSPNI